MKSSFKDHCIGSTHCAARKPVPDRLQPTPTMTYIRGDVAWASPRKATNCLTARSVVYLTMKPMAARTHERILDQGLEMLSVTGLSGVTFGALAEAVGMSKSGLFAHFRSKEDIQRRLLRHAEALVERHVVGPAMAEPPGLPRLAALMRHWLGWTRRAGLGGGCPMASALFELDDLDGEIRKQVGEAEARSTISRVRSGRRSARPRRVHGFCWAASSRKLSLTARCGQKQISIRSCGNCAASISVTMYRAAS